MPKSQRRPFHNPRAQRITEYRSEQTAEGNQQHSRAQEKRIDELVLQLEEEREARRVLSLQLQALTQSVNALSTEPGKPAGRERRK
jgi:hypothetical protein